MEPQFAALLDAFTKLPPPVSRPLTFLEIAGCHRKESVCSKMLAFFFDPKQSHGLGTLFLDALAHIDKGPTHEWTIGSNVSVRCEVSTDAGNRIDILIQSDSHVIVIENKLFASIGNPFADYARYAETLPPTERDKHKFLLTLTPSSAGAEDGFQNITHGQFVNAIRELLEHDVAPADTHYLTFMRDFLNTLDHLLQEKTIMDQAFVDFLVSHADDVEAFLTKAATFTEELHTKVKDLRNLIKVHAYSNVRRAQWHSGWSPRYYLVYTIKVSQDLSVEVDIPVCATGWCIEFKAVEVRHHKKVRTLLQHLEIPFEEDNEYYYFPTSFEYTERLEHIAPIVQDIVLKLANSHKAS